MVQITEEHVEVLPRVWLSGMWSVIRTGMPLYAPTCMPWYSVMVAPPAARMRASNELIVREPITKALLPRGALTSFSSLSRSLRLRAPPSVALLFA